MAVIFEEHPHLQARAMVGRLRLAASSGHGAASHGHAVITLLRGGRARVEQHGSWTLEAGDLLMIPPGAAHRTLEAHDAEVLGMGLELHGNPAWQRPFDAVRAGAAAVVRLPAARQAFVETLMLELERPAPPEVQTSLINLVLHEVTPRLTAAPHPVAGLTARALQFIEQHALTPLRLEDVARALGRSPAHLTRTVHAETGLPVVQWIIRHRMAEARRQLLHTEIPVEELAGRVGYSDPTHFIRLFRRQQGETPARFRARHRTAGALTSARG